MSPSLSTDGVPGTATGVQKTPAKLPGYQHPLDPLTPEEIVAVSLGLRKYVAEKTDIKAVRFITSSLLPPPKKSVLAFLGIPLATGKEPEHTQTIVRKAEVDFVDAVIGNAYNSVLALKEGNWEVETLDKLPEGVQPQISVEELLLCEDIIRADERVQKLAKEVGKSAEFFVNPCDVSDCIIHCIGVEPHQLCADGWAIGYDDRFPVTQRVQQALLFARLGRHENLYAHPMDFIPVVDSITKKVIHIDFPPRHTKPSSSSSMYSPTGLDLDLSSSKTTPPTLSEDAFSASNRERIPPPLENGDFLPDLMKENAEKTGKPFKLRDDIKPLHIVQPEGVSFKMNGHELEWQKWKMHISFHHREGLVLSTITYNDDGVIRPIIIGCLCLKWLYLMLHRNTHIRGSSPSTRSGEYGMGTMANELALGCDCLGQIHYLPGAFVKHDGTAFVIKNVICIHEEDAGLLWKHTDFRVGGRSQAVRSRRLVVQMICTLANYEYMFNYSFYQDGNINLDIGLSGILQVYAEDKNTPASSPFATTLAPGVSAQYHQHLFSVRVDPMIDGLSNTVTETDVIPLPNAPTGSPLNHAGNAFITKTQSISKQSEGARDYDLQLDRRWAITNPTRKHPYSGKAAGYTIMGKGAVTPLLARDDSWVAKRAAFAKKALWVVRDKEGPKGSRVWPAGKYVPQTRDSPPDSVVNWAKGDDNLDGEDILLFITMGTFT
ncbi:hypothetical protein EW026_g5317 [Hermanssonia centrifuga]|uniref:Amine oxidase n=1 Tax=Hermanssonia centrifuga TaxID=98765 RepID=A0A4S4KEE9_9APHY|nr:hypothetical protein EW026_g5317 [Hermanssonia centrifuga]